MRLDSAAADRVTALVLFLLGAASTYGGFVMDRLEIRRIHPASIPGLVPMMLGVALMICAIILAWSAARTERSDETGQTNVSWASFLITLIWSGIYALAAIGAVPFAPATAVYVAGFTLWFLWTESEAQARPGTLAIVSVLVFSIATAVGISVLFRYGFLVRLP